MSTAPRLTLAGQLKRYARRIKYFLNLSRPNTPQHAGMDVYRRRSSWPLLKNACPCDVEFAEYLVKVGAQDKAVFHFGTGEHHIVGRENRRLERPNHVLGITAAALEHDAFVKLVLKDKELEKHYSVLFKDVYTLTAQTLPTFDYASLFHLCEFYSPEEAPHVHLDDASLLDLLLSKLNPQGQILFYTGSFAWDRAKKIVADFVETGKIEEAGQYKTLLAYQVPER